MLGFKAKRLLKPSLSEPRTRPALQALLLYLALLLIPATLHAAGTGEAPTTAWNYHPWPPFMSAPGQGAAWELAGLLNRQLGTAAQLRVESVARTRLNRRLASGDSGVVLLANPGWFGDPACRKYLVSDPLMWEFNELLSRSSDMIEYRGPSSLHQRMVGFLPGFRLEKLDADIQRGLIRREDSVTSRSNVARLLRGDIDAAIIPATQLLSLEYDAGAVHQSKQPYSRVTRHLLFTPDLAEMYRQVNAILRSAAFRAAWRQSLAVHRAEHLMFDEERIAAGATVSCR